MSRPEKNPVYWYYGSASVAFGIKNNAFSYLLLIYAEEGTEPQPGTPEGDAFLGEYMKFGEELTANQAMVGGNALQPIETATTVRVRGGESDATDGPFAETKEQLGGYDVIEAKDLDEAWTTGRVATEIYGVVTDDSSGSHVIDEAAT